MGVWCVEEVGGGMQSSGVWRTCGMCLQVEVGSMREDREGVLNDGFTQLAKCLLAVAAFWGEREWGMLFYVANFVTC